MALLETISTSCPYCAEPIKLVIDCSEEEQSYIEDCFVCCQPISLEISIDPNGFPFVRTKHQDQI